MLLSEEAKTEARECLSGHLGCPRGLQGHLWTSCWTWSHHVSSCLQRLFLLLLVTSTVFRLFPWLPSVGTLALDSVLLGNMS